MNATKSAGDERRTQREVSGLMAKGLAVRRDGKYAIDVKSEHRALRMITACTGKVPVPLIK